MFAKGKEAPSVVSTRVLRTHRLNEVENFRLHGKIRNIDSEIQSNYSQISDEIDGVKKNLTRIKKLKNNLSVSVERRKLLRERGVFVIPSPGLDDDEGVTLRRCDGRKVVIKGKECYDGEVIRRCIDINFNFIKQSNLDTNAEDDEDDENERVSFEDPLHDKRRVFHYRIIVPPLHPGSRRNFKDYEDDEEEHDLQLDLPPSEEYMSNLRSSPFRIRAQTAVQIRKESKQSRRRPKSQPLNSESKSTNLEQPAQVEQIESEVEIIKDTDTSLAEALDDLSTHTSSRKQNLESTSQYLRPKTADETVKSTRSRRLSCGHHRPLSRSASDNRERTESDPFHYSRRVSKVTNDHLAPQDSHKLLERRPSCEENVKINIVKAIQDTKEETETEKHLYDFNEEVDDSYVIESVDVLTDEISWTESISRTTLPIHCDTTNRTVKKPSRKRSEALHLASNLRTTEDDQSVISYNSRFSSKRHTESFNSNANASNCTAKGRRKSTVTFTESERKHRVSNNEIISYDARPDKALSKGYSTMQMTIRGKQVRICVPKFSKDDVIDRARAKSAAQMADERTRGSSNASKQQKQNKQQTRIS